MSETEERRDELVAAWLAQEAPAVADPGLAARIASHARSTSQASSAWLWFASPWGRITMAASAGMLLIAAIISFGSVIAPPTVGPESTHAPAPTIVPSSDPPRTSSIAPSATPLAEAELLEWPVRAMAQPVQSYGGAFPTDVAHGGPGLVAVGFMTPCCADASYDSDPWLTMIWTSVDGVDWQLVPDLESFGKSGLRAIAADDSGTMLAVGYEVLPPAPSADPAVLFVQEGRAWRSSNGIDWLSLDLPDGDYREVLATSSDWYVAGTSDGHPAIWTSSDLTEWSATVFEGTGVIDEMVVGPDGTVVATGCVAGADLGCRPVAFALASGNDEWVPSQPPISVNDIVSSSRGFVAVGYSSDGPASAVSLDGVRWEAGPDLGEAAMWAVTAAEGSLIAGGDHRDAGGFSQAALWRSTDGLNWEPVAAPARVADQVDGSVRVVAGTDRGVTALGQGFVFGGQALAWHGQP